MNIDQIKINVEKHKKVIEKDRDSLDDFIQELKFLRDDCDEALEGFGEVMESLDRVRDSLSRMV